MFKLLRTIFAVLFTVFVLTWFLHNAMAQKEQAEDEIRSNRTESKEELSTVIGDGGVHHIYVDPKRLFRLSPPGGWQIDESPGEEVSVKFIAPDNSDVEISIKVTKAKGDLESIKEKFKNKNKDTLEDYNFLLEVEYIIDGEKGYMIYGRFFRPSKWKSETKCSEVIYIKEDRLFYLKYTAPLDEYDKYFPVFRGRLMTFESL